MLAPLIIGILSTLAVLAVSTLILVMAVSREADNITLYDHVKARQATPTPTHINVPQKEAA